MLNTLIQTLRPAAALKLAALTVATLATASLLAPHQALAAEGVVATVNGEPLTELDMQLAETEIGRDLGQLPTETKRRVLIEYLIENFLFAKAAEEAKLDSDAGFDKRMRYMRRRALRETYFENKIKKSVSDAAAEVFYKDRIKGMKPKEEIQARHILVETEATARDMVEQIGRGTEFTELAKKHSIDPGTKPKGGLLGYFTQGQMVPAFEAAAFALKKGEISDPVKSRFGWHIIKLEDRRMQPIPTFAEVKQTILDNMIHQQTQAAADKLRKSATIAYVDPDIKKHVEDQNKKEADQQSQFERQVREMEEKKKQKETAPQPETTP